jgi:hypothetical protein
MRYKKTLLFFSIIILTMPAESRPGDSTDSFDISTAYVKRCINLFGTSSPDESSSLKNKKIDRLIRHLRNLQSMRSSFRTPGDFVRYVFSQTHALFLHRYKRYTTLDNLWYRGEYDCVTATALFSILFKGLGIVHTIHETSYHTYLFLDELKILIETTDPINGCLDTPLQINRMIERYHSNRNDIFSPRRELQENFMDRKVELIQLAGLQFFNQAVQAFNSNRPEIARQMINKALSLYYSRRLLEIRQVLLSFNQ